MSSPTVRSGGSTLTLTVASLAAAALAGMTGCQSKPPTRVPEDQLRAGKPAQPIAQTEAQDESAAPVDSAQALTIKAEAWAREMETMMGKRGVLRPGAAGEPSVVDFMDSNQFTLGLPQQGAARRNPAEPPVTVVPVANPVVQATPSDANRGAALGPGSGQGQSLDNKARPAAAVAANTGAGPLAGDGGFDAVAPPSSRDASVSGGELEQSLSKQLVSHGKDLWAHLDFQLLQFLKDRPTPQLDALAKLATEDRELISSVMDGLTNFRNALRAENNMLMSRKVRPLLEMADRLRSQADLTIPAVALCTKVDGFGAYDPIEPARFTAMKEHRVIVYCEVENFASHQNDKRLWETRLSQEVVLYTESGLPVWQDKTEMIPDFARRRRHDFFIVKPTRLPGNVAIGRYLLKVTIVDQQASRVAEATIPVQFVAQ